MPIAKGEDWGRPGELPSGAPICRSDNEATQAMRDGAPAVRLTRGDLARTLGIRPEALDRPVTTLVVCDAIAVSLDDGDERLAAAHVVVGRRLRRSVAIMNAAFVDEANLAPRAHPGDGLLDVVGFDLSLTDWFKARRRLPTGTHVPHPSITMRRASHHIVDLARAEPVSIDGVPAGRARRIECRVIDAALTVGI